MSEHEGRIERRVISGPISGIPLIIESQDYHEGPVYIDELFRPFIGKFVSIKIEEIEDAIDSRPSAEQQPKYTPRGRRGY